MSALRAALRPLYDTPVGDRVRAWTGIRSLINVRPFAPAATVSDLFSWRVDSVWETCFEVVNLPSLLYPGDAPADRVTLVLFADNGREIGRHEINLAPFERRRVEIEPLLDGATGAGSFACFHTASALEALPRFGCHLSERGYTGFRRRGDRLWSFVHGNQHVLSATPDGALSPIGAKARRDRTYSPQLRFDDAEAFDLSFANPVGRPVRLQVRFLAASGRETAQSTVELPERATVILTRRNGGEEPTATIEARGRSNLWRPLVFKHYKSHFDVFHG